MKREDKPGIDIFSRWENLLLPRMFLLQESLQVQKLLRQKIIFQFLEPTFVERRDFQTEEFFLFGV